LAGEVLKKRREESGVDIKAVSDILKIRSEYLSAIEDDDFDKLPAAVYTIGYIRCYAKYLDVDAGPVIANFTSHLSYPKPSIIIPIASSVRKVPVYFYVIFVLLAGLLAFAVYIYMGENRTSGKIAEKINPSVEEKTPVPVAQIEHRLEITSMDTAWLRISYENGKSQEALLRAGDLKRWEFRGAATLRIGNAGGVTLKFDGKDLGVPGNPGQALTLTFPPSQGAALRK